MTSKWKKKTVMRARKKELGDWHKIGTESQKCSHYPVKSATRSMSTREQWLTKQKWPSWEMTMHPHVWWDVQNLLHCLKLFQHMLCYPSRTLLHMANCPKNMPRLLTVIYTCQYKGHCHEICARHTLRIHTPNLHQVRMHWESGKEATLCLSNPQNTRRPV